MPLDDAAPDSSSSAQEFYLLPSKLCTNYDGSRHDRPADIANRP